MVKSCLSCQETPASDNARVSEFRLKVLKLNKFVLFRPPPRGEVHEEVSELTAHKRLRPAVWASRGLIEDDLALAMRHPLLNAKVVHDPQWPRLGAGTGYTCEVRDLHDCGEHMCTGA